VAGPPRAPELTLLSALDAAEEVRGVVRRVASDLAAGVPLWRIGVLYGAEEPYGALVREALDAVSGAPAHDIAELVEADEEARRLAQGRLAPA